MASELLDRVPFELAIKSPKLLKPRWDTLSKAQQTVLRIFYGLPLDEEGLYYWNIFQGGATFDELGFVTSVSPIPYHPKEYDFLNLYVGRRSGKTDKIISTAALYEITLGGHRKHLPEGQEMKIPFIAQTAGDAQKNMNFIRLAAMQSPLLSKEITSDVVSEIRFRNGATVEPAPANKAVGRGHAIPVFIGDEMAFWYTDPNAANPDFEVLRAIQYAQAQFPNAKVFAASTPWAEQGVMWENWKAGTEGRNLKCDVCTAAKVAVCEHPLEEREKYEGILVIHAPTAVMGNPEISRKRLIQIRKRDPEAFPRESLAQTLKSISGWLPHQEIDNAIDSGITIREPIKAGPFIPTYIATIDPAFRKDSFAFSIVHHDQKLGIVQDFLKYWTPSEAEALKPGEILDQIKLTLDEYGLTSVTSDQYQLESLQQLAMDRGFTINGYDFTGKSKAVITGGFKVLLREGRLKLLDNEEQTHQLKSLQRRVLQTGSVQISAPPNKHDDVAMVLMLGTRVALYLLMEERPEDSKPKDVEHDHVKMAMDTIEKHRLAAMQEEMDYD